MDKLQEKWEKRATVRSRPRNVFDSDHTLSEGGYFFPRSHQPLCIHPKVVELGEEAINYLLVQSLYKYSNDIATIETRVVNNAILTVVMDSLPIKFTSEQKMHLYTIMVDEAYHAYVAFDSMLQIQEFTQIEPLPLPKTIEIELAIKWAHEQLPQECHGIFDLIAVCLAENTLTKEIVSFVSQEGTHHFFTKMLEDHLADESRHCGIFFNLLGFIWKDIDMVMKKQIAAILPEYLTRYLGLVVEMEFDREILISLEIPEDQANKMLDEVYGHFKLTKENPKLKNILLQLHRSGVIDEITSPYFKEKNWI